MGIGVAAQLRLSRGRDEIPLTMRADGRVLVNVLTAMRASPAARLSHDERDDDADRPEQQAKNASQAAAVVPAQERRAGHAAHDPNENPNHAISPR